jgi:uncharacterized phage protein (TIGR01671 family)|nr:MAG TPA: YopX protein [Bacteriophage sp.]
MEDRYLSKAKRIDNGEWVQGYLFGIWEERYILWGMTNDIPDMIEVDPSTICQCTGLRDKNGKLICENDIVKGHRISFGSHRHIGKVKYINGRYEIIGVKQYAGFSDALRLSYEVLGNIFDNPELLESEE